MTITVPDDDGAGYPSLGGQLVAWMQENLVFGPGDLRGQPLQMDDEFQAFIWRCYELYPKGHPKAGRHRFRRCGMSLPKGLAKTERAALIAAAELHPDAPVRFNGWQGRGLAPGRGVTDPYVAMIAYTEEQSDELCFGALKAILEASPICGDFDIGLERILRKDGRGKAVSLAGSPSARDGMRVTFVVCDETHWWTLPRLKQAHQTLMAGLPKRTLADAWMLEITTSPEPGAGSIAEQTMDFALSVRDGRITDPGLFYFHRQASDEHDLTTAEGARAAVIEASGSAASWRDIDGIMALWADPTTDRAYWERVWCNRLVRGAAQAFDVTRWRSLARAESPVQPGDLITIGFDGSLFHDATGIICTHVKTGYQWMGGVWEAPPGRDDWQVPAAQVDAVMRDLFTTYKVWRLYADPPYWQSWIAQWRGVYGEDRVKDWWTNRRRPMTTALENFHTAIAEGHISHDDDPALRRHIGNARRQDILMRAADGQSLWLIRKERSDSPHKIDLAMAAVLSWEGRTDAIAAGVLETRTPTYTFFVLGADR